MCMNVKKLKHLVFSRIKKMTQKAFLRNNCVNKHIAQFLIRVKNRRSLLPHIQVVLNSQIFN